MDEPEPPQAPNGRPTAKGKANAKRKASDRFGVLNRFVDFSMTGLTRSELTTWLILYRDTRNGTAATSQANIAKRSGASVRAIKRAIKKLTEAGLLVVVYQGGLNRGASRYRVEPLGKRTS